VKGCPSCGRLYPDDAGFCPIDGLPLTSATLAPAARDHQDARLGSLVCERYEVRRVIADGGMGRVYEALDTFGRGNVALKILHPDVASDPVCVERFRREFAVSTQLPHEHIVEVFDFRPTSDGSYVLVMEFLYGEELRATLQREGVLAPARVVRMLSQLAIGLDPPHARRLVHRDLKPDNVFLCQTRDGDIVKILDFGSVKDKADTALKLTVVGTTIGSPYYMAPEQAQGLDTLDHRADVWALAAIAYECVTGRVPFQGSTGTGILVAILTKQAERPSVAGAGQKYPVPGALDAVMAQAFMKNPGQRIATVGALADAVGAAYGLSGEHRQWAVTPESVLAERIAQQPGQSAVAMGSGSTGMGQPGVDLGLATMHDPFADITASRASNRPPPNGPASEDGLTIPKMTLGWSTLLTVALLVALVVAAIALVVR
jgi:serine/threonine-protein kinase